MMGLIIVFFSHVPLPVPATSARGMQSSGQPGHVMPGPQNSLGVGREAGSAKVQGILKRAT